LSVAGKVGAVTLVKGDVGLGSVENYGIATQAEAEAGTSNVKYMTPLRVFQAIAIKATAALITLTGYVKPSTTSALAAGDALNGAFGKLERALDDKAPTNVTLTDAAAADTLPVTTSATIAALLQTVRNNLKMLFSYFTSGAANKAVQLNTARVIDGVSFNGTADITHYATCSTEAATAAKVAALAGFTLQTGAVVQVLFTVTNTAASPTLNVNSTGAKPIYYRNAVITAGYLAANRLYEFVYDGAQYELVGDINVDTTYTAMTSAEGITGTATTSRVMRADYLKAIIQGTDIDGGTF
jgi:hypothetical protein